MKAPPLRLLLTSILAAAALLCSCDKNESTAASSTAAGSALQEAARIKSSQRHFLLTGICWEDYHWQRIGALIDRFDEYRAAREQLLSTPGVRAREKSAGRELAQLRAEMEFVCAQFENMTRLGRTLWDAWEAKKWAGYPLPINGAAGYPDIFFLSAEDGPPDTRQALAAADFLARREAACQPLRETARRTGTREQELLDLIYRDLKPMPPGQEKDAALHEIRTVSAARRAALSDLRSLYAESAKLQAGWTAKNWEGYAIKDTPSATPLSPIPLPGNPGEPGTLP